MVEAAGDPLARSQIVWKSRANRARRDRKPENCLFPKNEAMGMGLESEEFDGEGGT